MKKITRRGCTCVKAWRLIDVCVVCVAVGRKTAKRGM